MAMQSPVSRSVSVRRRRYLELACMLCVIVATTLVTFPVTLWRPETVQPGARCGPDSPSFSVDISHAEASSGEYVTPEGLRYPQGTFWIKDGAIYGCPCLLKPCFRKCCPLNMKYSLDVSEQKAVCTEESASNFHSHLKNSTNTEHREDDEFFIFTGDVCSNGKYHLDEDEHQILEDGTVKVVDDQEYFYKDQSQYCLETFLHDGTLTTMLCVEGEDDDPPVRDWTVYRALAVGEALSVPFLLATLLVYLLLPPLQNLHGKTLLCHISCLTIAFSLLSAIQFGVIIAPSDSCMIAAFAMQFTFLGSFFWLNIMCFDIWWVFSGLQPFRGSIQKREHFKFLWYSVYAFGGALLITCLSAVVEFSPWTPGSLVRPQFNVNQCWFKERKGQVIYFYLPVGCLLLLNLMMFTTTSCRIQRQASGSSKLFRGESRRHNHGNSRAADQTRFYLYLKLFLVMGVNWLMEVISFICGGHQKYWLMSDIGNTLQGVFIFAIFVCNKRTLRLLRHQFSPSFHQHQSVRSSDCKTESIHISRSFSSARQFKHDIEHQLTNSVLK